MNNLTIILIKIINQKNHVFFIFYVFSQNGHLVGLCGQFNQV
jgi:hypothetical protein